MARTQTMKTPAKKPSSKSKTGSSHLLGELKSRDWWETRKGKFGGGRVKGSEGKLKDKIGDGELEIGFLLLTHERFQEEGFRGPE